MAGDKTRVHVKGLGGSKGARARRGAVKMAKAYIRMTTRRASATVAPAPAAPNHAEPLVDHIQGAIAQADAALVHAQQAEEGLPVLPLEL